MKIKLAIIISLLITISAPALAGEGHSHSHGGGHKHSHGGHSHSHAAPIEEDAVKIRAQEEITRLIKKGKLEDSWSKAEYISSEKKSFKGKKEWLVTYKNEASEKKNLFIFLSLSGRFIAANHTGK